MEPLIIVALILIAIAVITGIISWIAELVAAVIAAFTSIVLIVGGVTLLIVIGKILLA